jgi:hypothetical protein
MKNTISTGRAMPYAAGHWCLTAQALDQNKANSFGICGEQIDTGTRLSRSTVTSACQNSSLVCNLRHIILEINGIVK